MQSWPIVEKTTTPDGAEFVLGRNGDDWVVRVDQKILMGTRMFDSELALAEYGLALAQDPTSVLVGGLGIGYTLRAVLDRVGPDTEVTVAELVPELVEWNHKYLGAINDRPLDDPRCKVIIGDIIATIKRPPTAYSVMLLDVDNGPHALAQPRNQWLYGDRGVTACRAALKPGGVLAVWSNGPSARYERKLRKHGFELKVERVTAREGSGMTYFLFLATRR